MTEQQISKAPMGEVNPWKDPSVAAKINQQGLGGAAGRGETRRLSTPPLPVRFESKEVKIYGLQYDASVLGLATLHLLRKGQLDLVLADKDVERMAGSGIRYDMERRQFFVDDKPVLKDGTTFPVNWIVKANGRIPQAFVRIADTKINPIPPAEPEPATAAPLAVPVPGEQVVKVEDKPVAFQRPDEFDNGTRIPGSNPSDEPLDDFLPTATLEDKSVTFNGPEDYAQSMSDIAEAETTAREFVDAFIPPATLADAQEAHDNAPEAKPFVWDDKARKTFFSDVGPLMTAAGIIGEKAQTEFRHAVMGGSLKEYKGTPEHARKLIEAALMQRQRMTRKEQPVTTPVKTAPTNNRGYVAPTTPDEILSKYMVNLKGKWYLQVPGRVLMFRLAKPRGRIVTELLNATDEAVVFKAMIYDEDDRLLATGHARATFAKSENFSGRVFEKAETAAIGRALAHAGYGTDQAGDDMDETDDVHGAMHLADAPR